MKWFWIAVLIVVGIVAAVFAFEYLAYSNYNLPTWVPGNAHGHMSASGKPVRGNHVKRGYGAAVVAVAAFAGAGWLIYKNMRADKAAASAPVDS
jgi:uncharacterized membrane protein